MNPQSQIIPPAPVPDADAPVRVRLAAGPRPVARALAQHPAQWRTTSMNRTAAGPGMGRLALDQAGPLADGVRDARLTEIMA